MSHKPSASDLKQLRRLRPSLVDSRSRFVQLVYLQPASATRLSDRISCFAAHALTCFTYTKYVSDPGTPLSLKQFAEGYREEAAESAGSQKIRASVG